jgi:hypothetical protein
MRERVSLGPPFFFEVGNDVLTGGFVVTDLVVPHSIRRPSCKFVEPMVDFLERPSKPEHRLVAVLVKG